MLFSQKNILKFLHAFGAFFVLVAYIGIVIGVFELAFNQIDILVIIRLVLHLICIPIGGWLEGSQLENSQESLSLHDNNRILLSFCFITIGTIGIIIGTIELGIFRSTGINMNSLGNRMIIYFITMFFGIYISPFKHPQK